MLSARKDLSITPSTKMKQLQWDKLPQQQAAKTVFSDEEPLKEEEWVRKLQTDGVWMEMEEDFKAKQLVINLMGASSSSVSRKSCQCRGQRSRSALNSRVCSTLRRRNASVSWSRLLA